MSLFPLLPCALILDEASKVGEARRLANVLAERMRFDETARGNLAIVVTEAATNLVKFAPGGELIFRELGDEAGGLELLSVDKGPGMAKLEKCMADGFSTAGTPGGGLGAMSRLSAEFEIHSTPGAGTVAMCRLAARSAPSKKEPPPRRLRVGAVSLPIPGETLNGDSWAIARGPGDATDLIVVDGLGHGPHAAQAAGEATRVFREKSAEMGLEDLVRATHEALRPTRGAALAVCRIDHDAGEVEFAGVGNISAAIVNPGDARDSSLVSYNGTVGHVIRKVQTFRYPWGPGALLILHSDGLGTRWDLGRYPGLASRHPGLIAGVLFRDFRRVRDDATVVVIGQGAGEEGWW